MKTRNEYELDLMKQSGKVTALALKKCLQNIKSGVSAIDLDKVARGEIISNKAKLAFPTIDDYKWATCITFNEQVVHGIPTNRQVRSGDLISVDVGAIFKGWFTDAAWTYLVPGDSDEAKAKFLKVGEQALWDGISQAVEGKRIGDISSAIQQRVESGNYSVVRSLVGHGVGKSLHEDPQIPCFGQAGSGPILKAGMTLAIEVIYSYGSPEVKLETDGWTISTADGSLAGLFEMSIIVGKEKAEVITDWRKV